MTCILVKCSRREEKDGVVFSWRGVCTGCGRPVDYPRDLVVETSLEGVGPDRDPLPDSTCEQVLQRTSGAERQ